MAATQTPAAPLNATVTDIVDTIVTDSIARACAETTGDLVLVETIKCLVRVSVGEIAGAFRFLGQDDTAAQVKAEAARRGW